MVEGHPPRFHQSPSNSFKIHNRLTVTEPPHLASQSPHYYPAVQIPIPTSNPLPPSISCDPLPPPVTGPRPPSRPESPRDGASSKHISGKEPAPKRFLQDPDNSAEVNDTTLLTQSKSSDILVSSAEPSSIHAAASTHIDTSGLKYEFSNLKTRIGVGTYGSVFIGNYFGEHVAIKRIRIPSVSPGLADDPLVAKRHAEAIRQFAREIRRYERVQHPCIVRFYGVTLTPDPAALLVSEFMPGGSLGEAMMELRKDGIPFDLTSVLRIAMQTCSGLRALHGHGCTWGDAKPENILLSEALDNGFFPKMAEARIADFGLSKSVGQTLLGETTLAGSGQPAGTYNYMAPETFTVSDRDSIEKAKSSDVYSLGMVVYEMLTLRTPWDRRRMSDVLVAVRSGERPKWPAPSDHDFRDPIPQELRDIVECCWHQDWDKRPSSESLFSALFRFYHPTTDRTSQRPITELALNGPVFNGDGRQSTGAFTHVVSKQSTMSTAIAIGDASVDLGSNVLGSTTDSRGYFDVPEGLVDVSDGAETAPVGNPTVSPVTSPEPRRPSRTGVGQLDSDNDVRRSNGSLGTGSQTAIKHMAGTKTLFQGDHSCDVGSRKDGRNALLESRDGWANSGMNIKHRPDFPGHLTGSIEDGNGTLGPLSNLNFAHIPSEEFIKHRDEIARATASTAARIVGNGDSEEHDDAFYDRRSTVLTGGSNVPANVIGPSYGESDLVSSNTSTSSARRKRSKRLHSIIEQAAVAFIELRRREQNKLPPKQRKEAAEKRAEEEARISNEKEALKVIAAASKVEDFSTILKQMKLHRNSHAVVRASMSEIENYCRYDSVFFDICEEGGVEELVSGATLHGADDDAVAVSFCNSILALSEHCNDKVGHMVRAVGAPSLVIELLEHHKVNVEVQRVGCECLAMIAGSSELSRSAVATLGGPSAIYRAMTKNNFSFKDADLARSALKAIKSIAQDNEKAAEYLVQVAALDTVSKAAEVFTDHGLEGDILSALRAFSFYDAGRRNVIMSSGLKALTAIMVRNKEPDFLVQCCTFIRALSRWRDHECEAAMLESCISSRIIFLMQLSNDIPGEHGAKVAWYSSHACTFLASFGSRSRQRLRDVGAIETAINILRSRKENARVVHSATDALAELLKGEKASMHHAENCGIVPALNEALVLHHSVVRVRSALEWTLNYLTAPSPYDSRVYQELINSNRQQPGRMETENTPQPARFWRNPFSRKR